MKNLLRLACKFDLDQRERKPSEVKAWPNGVASRPRFSTCVYLRLRLARALHWFVVVVLPIVKAINNAEQSFKKYSP